MRFLAAVLGVFLAVSAGHADEANDRKERSVAVMMNEGVPVLPTLPVIETEATSLRRTQDEVIERTIALAIAAVKGETGDHALGLALIEQFGAEQFFSPDERAFMADPSPDQHTRVQFSWRYEGVHVMLWALGIYHELGRPDQITNVPLLAETLRDLGTDGLRATARLRPQAEILDAADLIYRYHWAVVNARVTGLESPAGLDSGVVMERHHALNWLIGYMGQPWDDISTDT